MNKPLAYLFVLLFITISGCQVSTEPEVLSTITPSPSATLTGTPTWTPTASQTLFPTYTPTSTQTSTKTATNTLTATWTPVSTMNAEAALERIRELYQYIEPCKFPCWWGITPGQTTWAQARQILSEIQPEQGPYYREILTRYKYSFEVPARFEALGLGFIEASIFVNGDKVVAISTNTGWIHQDFDYSRTNLLALFGQPDEIWLRHTTPESELIIEYEMELLYKSDGILLNISGEAKKQDDRLVICPQKFQRGAFPAAITMYASKITNSFDQLREMLFGKYDVTEPRYVRLQTITEGFGESEFYQLYKNEDAPDCFTVDVK